MTSPEDLEKLAPGTEVFGNAGVGDSRAALSCVQDVSKFRTALVTAYNREASRKAVEADAGSSSAVT